MVGCGGTSKTATSETVWNDNPGETDGEGTGGGYSTVFSVQSFQIGAPPAPAGTKLGFVTPKLWQNQAAFNDITITQGGNGFYNAAPGPDPCSGIGSPIGTKIAALFTS